MPTSLDLVRRLREMESRMAITAERCDRWRREGLVDSFLHDEVLDIASHARGDAELLRDLATAIEERLDDPTLYRIANETL
jgi:hypothetical protein